ncbi:replication-associated recombination protein A [Metamycoplasma phocicerebrale]|uniref:Replication-associated recombination protein A n=1 Tax=Metamycoplasma phocicerebrale TaxID=142649 RepID=A0A3Q9VA53_9BACT|nr:replication-associated recombination protein A [Metamycoplasma phocicerebrale]AZZ65475.1 replication-associated recombination protein A [Metamycoplasma phocicerebrale]
MKANLANSLRPQKLDDFVCSTQKRELFQSIIENKDYSSFIFYGKPGTGKTTIANILANSLNCSYDFFNAAIDNKEDLLIKIKNNNIVIIDEIHRLNKDKQDILLPYLENDFITIYGTTTENPYFKINPALRSRSHIIEIESPSTKDIIFQLNKIAFQNNIEWLKNKDIQEFIAIQSNSDFRSALNNVELINKLSKKETISLEQIKFLVPSIKFYSDKNGDAHYDLLSAFHKSLRGSDPDAALYWGLLILKSGDVDNLFRRLLCATYEDVGLANPALGQQVLSAIESYERLGMPEGYLPIGFAILNVALSPKSNSNYLAINKIKNLIDNGYIYEPPIHLKDSHYSGAKKLGRGINYKYPHDYENNYTKQEYLPNELKNKEIFNFQNQGMEKKIKEYWNKIKKEEW